MSDDTKILIVIVAVLLYLHWRGKTTSLSIGAASAAGNPVATTSTVATSGFTRKGAGNGVNFRETWGTFQ